MLMVDLRDLQRGPVETVGEVAVDDEALVGLALPLTRPLAVRGRLQATGEGDVFWRGQLAREGRGARPRCLTDGTLQVAAPVDVPFSTDADASSGPRVQSL